MMSLALRKGKGWMLIEVERRRNVPSMIAVYTTGLTRPLNSVLIFIFISLGQLLSCARWVFNFYLGSCRVSFRTSTPDHHRAVTGEVEGGERGSVFSARCHRRAIVPRHRSRKREAAAFSPGAALPCRHHLSNGTLGENHR